MRGELEPLHSQSNHEGWPNALQAFLTADGSVKELPEHIVEERSAQATSPVALTQSLRLGPAVGSSHTLEEIADKWIKERAPIKRTVGQAQKVIGRHMEHMGQMKVQAITRWHVVKLKDKLLASGQTPVNTNKQLMILSILLNFAVANSIIDRSPAKGVKVEVRRNAKEARLPFDLHALNALFSSPIYAQGERPKGGAGEAAYWLPLLALFTGARIEELCQLHPSDVYEESYRELDGSERRARVLRITDEGSGASSEELRLAPPHSASP